MTMTTETRIDLFGKEFYIKCPEEHVADLQQAVRLLTERMTDIRDSGVCQFERTLLIAALNLAHQVNVYSRDSEKSVEQHLQRIYNHIDRVLQPNAQLELQPVI